MHDRSDGCCLFRQFFCCEGRTSGKGGENGEMAMEDYFGKEAGELKRKKLWLLDMDGTVYEEERLFDATPGFLQAIEEIGGHFIFVTNNSSKSVKDYVKKVRRMGLNVGEDAFFTSAQATVLVLQKQYPGAVVYCQGTESLLRELKDAGIRVTDRVEKVDVVLVGFDLELTMEKLRNTCEILTRQDPVYLATNPDLVYPVSFGFIPDCGSMCVMIRNATGKVPTVIGKPEPLMVNVVREKRGISAEETVIVGDRLYTDIATGQNAGITSVCVISGEATLADIENGTVKPTYTFQDVGAIRDVLMG